MLYADVQYYLIYYVNEDIMKLLHLVIMIYDMIIIWSGKKERAEVILWQMLGLARAGFNIANIVKFSKKKSLLTDGYISW